MTQEYRCEHCQRSFTIADALEQHNQSKHPELVKKSFTSFLRRTKKRMMIGTVLVILLGLVGWGVISSGSDGQGQETYTIPLGDTSHIPPGAVHWHPHLTIVIDGIEQPIPVGIGVTIGKRVDTHLSGMGMSPTHTHESDGTIHLENNNPSSKPATTTLGYFFYVWEKQLTKDCIFEYCTDEGTLKMYVNGKENTEFDGYLMKDKDDIRIEYTSYV